MQQIADEHQAHDQRVHAGLGGVAQRERGQGHDGDGDRGQHAAAAPAGGPPRKRQRQHRDHAGQGPHRDVARPEDLHPQVEQEVVERRVPVVAQGFADLVERQLGDVDAERLVEPERRAGDEAQHESQRAPPRP